MPSPEPHRFRPRIAVRVPSAAALVTAALALVGCCKPKWLEPSARTSTEASVAGEPFDIFDSSSALPTRSRPNAFRPATVRVTLPATPVDAARTSIALSVEAAVQDAGGGGTIMVELTMPDGSRREARRSVESPLVFCPKAPAPCEATFGVRMTYHGTGGTGHVTWSVKAIATASTDDGKPAPSAPPAPAITAALGAP